jgi:hypothetical protein
MGQNDRNRARTYRRVTFGQLQKRWMKTPVGQRRGPLKLGTQHMERALNFISFDMGVRLQIIRELIRKPEITGEAKARIKDHYAQLRKETDFLQKAGLYLLDANRQ